MKYPFRSLGLAVGLLGWMLVPCARGQAADLEIQGASVAKDKTEVLLMQKSTGNGRWVAIGQTFAGHTVVSYDDKTGRLILTKEKTTLILTLKKSTVQAAPASGVPPTAVEQKAIMNNLRQLGAAADQYFLENGVSKVEGSKLIGPNAYIKELKSVAGETYTGFIIEQGKPLRVKTSSGFEMEYKL